MPGERSEERVGICGWNLYFDTSEEVRNGSCKKTGSSLSAPVQLDLFHLLKCQCLFAVNEVRTCFVPSSRRRSKQTFSAEAVCYTG